MSDPKTRALELVGKLFDNALDFDDEPAAEQCAADLRLAITQIPTTSWQPMETAPIGEEVRLLVENTNVANPRLCRVILEAQFEDGRWWDEDADPIPAHLRPLAWRPADSTELPEDWGQLETMPHLFPNEARQAGEHKATHTWVPIAECGELADGEYVVRVDVLTVCVSEFVVTATRADGKFSIEIPDTLAHEITHVLSPNLGPIPEAK